MWCVASFGTFGGGVRIRGQGREEGREKRECSRGRIVEGKGCEGYHGGERYRRTNRRTGGKRKERRVDCGAVMNSLSHNRINQARETTATNMFFEAAVVSVVYS